MLQKKTKKIGSSLKASQLTPKVKKRKRKTLEQKTAQQLVDPADKAFSKYIRLRDCELSGTNWVGTCISCPRTETICWYDGTKWRWSLGWDNGHYITRGKYITRFDEYNCNLQCRHCNIWKDKGEMIRGYEKGLALKYGEDTVKELKKLSKAPDAYKRPGKAELLEIISDCKTRVEYILAHNNQD